MTGLVVNMSEVNRNSCKEAGGTQWAFGAKMTWY